MLTREDLAAIGELLHPIHERLDTMQGEITGLKEDVAGINGRLDTMQGEITSLKEDVAGLKTDVAGLKTDVAGINGRLDTMQGEITDLKERVVRVEIKVENGVDQAISVLSEGHQGILENMTKKEEVEEVKDRVSTLETVAKIHTAQIKELKEKIG